MGLIVKIFSKDNISMVFRAIRDRGFWNTVKYIFYDMIFELRYETDTVNTVELDQLNIESENKDEGNLYQPVTVCIFNKVFSKLDIDFANSTFIDFGCGKGRALLLAARYGFRKIIGVEFSSELCEICKDNVVKYGKANNTKSEIEVINADATTYEIPPEANVLFFNNPFGEKVMRKVVENIEKSFEENRRTILIIHLHPTYKNPIGENNYTELIAADNDSCVYEMGVNS
jgi:predicted RNA methylase